MLIGIPREATGGETRVALLPDAVARLLKLPGIQVQVEKGLGETVHAPDSAYEKAGAKLVDRTKVLGTSDLILRIRKPEAAEIGKIRKGAIHLSFLDPFRDPLTAPKLAAAGVSAISLEMIPRTTRAQRMDVLSSQANLAGYVAVLLASRELIRVFPMMMTPAGTLPPARVLIVGAGVAGLQAIATARRLGARVEAFDTRPVVKEQVMSLGAKFVEIDLGDTGQTAGGYAKQLTEEQLTKQRAGLAAVIAACDVVITTAQVFGRPAPRIVTKEMVAGMKAGSVVIDLAVDSGGNVEGSVPGKTVEIGGVRLVGTLNLPGLVAAHASLMLSGNFTAFVEEFWDKEKKAFKWNLEDDILKGCVITHGGEVIHEGVKKALAENPAAKSAAKPAAKKKK